MLQAQNGRQLNLAAEVVRTYTAAKGIDLKQSEALTLVGRLLGFSSYEAAKASLAGAPKGLASTVQTWRQLAHAIGTMTDKQLDMPVRLTEGTHRDGQMIFLEALSLLASKGDIRTPASIEVNQPTLHIRDVSLPLSNTEQGQRIVRQFEVATNESGDLAREVIHKHGLAGAVEELNTDYAILLGIGKFIGYSVAENAYWNCSFGFVHDKASATGFDDKQDFDFLGVHGGLIPVPYMEASDTTDD